MCFVSVQSFRVYFRKLFPIFSILFGGIQCIAIEYFKFVGKSRSNSRCCRCVNLFATYYPSLVVCDLPHTNEQYLDVFNFWCIFKLLYRNWQLYWMFVTILEKKSTAMPFIKPVWVTPTRIEQFCCFMCQWSVFCSFRVCYFLQWVKNYSWLQSNGSTWEFKTFDDLIRRVGIRRRLKNTSSFNRSTIVWYLLIFYYWNEGSDFGSWTS